MDHQKHESPVEQPIALGAASIETKGPPGDRTDAVGKQFAAGISND